VPSEESEIAQAFGGATMVAPAGRCRHPNSCLARSLWMTNSGDRVGQHAAIGQAIVNGDAASAETLMREHMEAYLKFVVKTHPTLLDEVIDWMT
jgi:hypothetical protein